MTNKKSTKRALLLSALSLLLCVSMLVGSTFAWFTDSVTSGKNTIQAGNLDVELDYKKVVDGKATEWDTVKDQTEIFNPNALWEPGHVEVVYLRVTNKGSLELKYQLGVNFKDITIGKTEDGKDIKLSDHLVFATVASDSEKIYANRDEVVKAAAGTEKGLKDYNGKTTALEVGGVDYLTLIVYMPETVGNQANYRGDAIPTIELGINLFATQYTAEEDSFDKFYDKDSAVDTIAEAEALMAAGKNVTLVGCNEPNGILVIPEAYTGTLTLANSTLKSVQGLKDANIVIHGNVVVNAKYDGPATLAATAKPFDGSAITANGALKISGTGRLTAIAADVNGAVGIGGKVSTTIENITIDKVTGSFVQQNFIKDTSYGKKEPEGGAAIGGAQITLKGVTIVEALGGSKAAGIGARFWNAAVIDIENCIINKVVGGNASAGIGGSRVSDDATVNQDIAIKIKDSQITAFGGQFGAGIGAGYDTHCAEDLITLPNCKIEITGNSVINATGGKYGAGIGTGYHTAGLSGSIADTVKVNAVGGGNREKYTAAMAVGFGVIDMDNPNREGAKAVNSSFNYKGTTITVQDAPVVVNSSEKLKAAIAAGETKVMLADGEYDLNGIQKDGLTLIGVGNEVKVANTTKYASGKAIGAIWKAINLENVTITNTVYTMADGGKSTFDNVNFAAGFRQGYGTGVVFTDCTFGSNSEGYALHFQTDPDSVGGLIKLNGCKFEGGKVHLGGKRAYEFTNCDFAAGTDFQVWSDVTLDGCTVNGEKVTAENMATLFPKLDATKVTIK